MTMTRTQVAAHLGIDRKTVEAIERRALGKMADALGLPLAKRVTLPPSHPYARSASVRGAYVCGLCGHAGHNARTCEERI